MSHGVSDNDHPIHGRLVVMERQAKSQAERNLRQPGLDLAGAADSESRRLSTDLPERFGSIDGEAGLLFAYLREILPEIIGDDQCA
jgi:hypothetical protein